MKDEDFGKSLYGGLMALAGQIPPMLDPETEGNAFRAHTGGGKGFRITFANGKSVSVIWNDLAFCDGGKTTAEVAGLENDDELTWIRHPSWPDENVAGHLTPDEVLAFMNYVAGLPS